MLFIIKSVQSANNGTWSVPILTCFCFTRPYSVTSINFYVTLYSQLIRTDILDFFSHAFHVSLGSSFTPSIRRLFLRNLSSNSINFADNLWFGIGKEPNHFTSTICLKLLLINTTLGHSFH